ncbi:HPF/RaiA family ribosome-associated protein [Pontiellaceae bacterium B1224]|nr:HPF/RaiA family ribosome-associated protein [Pontiellaceae bacterium B1224]
MQTAQKIKYVPSYYSSDESTFGIPVAVRFRHMHGSRHVLTVVDQLMEKFDKYALPDAHATVVVTKTRHHEGKGAFQVKVRLSVPGEQLYVAHSQETLGAHDGVYSALANCFERVERQLVKRHGRRIASRVHGRRAYDATA